MTVYSQHANRGKVQILATYNGDLGVTSSTVTSVDDPASAAKIVDALNRISASASVPVSIRDERSESYAEYPSGHLAAITDPGGRATLLSGQGEHGLWYEYALLMLHRAIDDLDTVIRAMPAPVRAAISAELDADVRGLRVGLQEYEDGSSEEKADRRWDFEEPFVLFDGGMAELSHGMRKTLNRLESTLPARHLARTVEDLRLLSSVYVTVESGGAILREEDLCIHYEHEDTPLDGHFLTIQAPRPGRAPEEQAWSIAIDQWVADERDSDGEITSSHGEPLVVCALGARPGASELISLLALAEGGPEQMSAWAMTPVGDALAGTAFIVTSRDEGGGA